MLLHAELIVLMQLDEHAVGISRGDHPGVIFAQAPFGGGEAGGDQPLAQRIDVVGFNREMSDGTLGAAHFPPG